MTEPRILPLDTAAPDKAIIAQATAVLEAGGLVVAPTETRYGLLARADSGESLGKLYDLKGRPVNLPTALFVKSIEDLAQFGRMSPIARRLAERFLPGPMTLVLNAVRDLGAPLVVNDKIGLRVSPAPVINMLIEKADFAVTATSANPSGGGEFQTVAEIADAFGERVELYLDGGRLSGPVSTVIDVTGESPVVLREGAVDRAEIGAILKNQLI
ncbi:MAG: threonylcarbamoyl-AMP synthase [candidate division Zixibacteria bacterium]|nr:threonylcarbamoyl-AMP synthase [candidate division Zixibacteria bacterium]